MAFSCARAALSTPLTRQRHARPPTGLLRPGSQLWRHPRSLSFEAGRAGAPRCKRLGGSGVRGRLDDHA
eukprot:2209944-Prymnesium_polylepis.1